MFTSATSKSINLVAALALLAGQTAFLTSTAPEAKAAPVAASAPQALAKGDRLVVAPKGTACSSQGWPYYEQGCQLDRSKPADAAPKIRIIALR